MQPFLAVGVLLISHGALAAEPADELNAWLEGLDMDPGALAELQRFEADEGDWPNDTPRRLATMFRERVRADVARAAARVSEGDLDPYVRVNYLQPRDFAHGREETSDKRGREFEEGVIRTEQLGFFPGLATPPAEALAAFVDPGFRKETSSRIESIEEDGDLSCIRTKGMWGLMDPTWSCNRLAYFDAGPVAAEHSQVVGNRGDGDFQSIYFKESVKIFLKTDRGLALYYINYTRGPKLGSLKKKLGRGRIEDSQRERADALARRLEVGQD